MRPSFVANGWSGSVYSGWPIIIANWNQKFGRMFTPYQPSIAGSRVVGQRFSQRLPWRLRRMPWKVHIVSVNWCSEASDSITLTSIVAGGGPVVSSTAASAAMCANVPAWYQAYDPGIVSGARPGSPISHV